MEDYLRICIYQAEATELGFLKVCSNPNRGNLLQLDCVRYMGVQQFWYGLVPWNNSIDGGEVSEYLTLKLQYVRADVK